MELTYNGLPYNTTNLITLSEVPNIIRLSEDITGSTPSVTLTFSAAVPSGNYITIDGQTVTSVGSASEAAGTAFYGGSTASASAFAVANALRSLPELNTRYMIHSTGSTVLLQGRSIGNRAVTVETSVLPAVMTYTSSDGSASSPLWGGFVYADLSVDGEYKATLKKKYANGDCCFNAQPLLSTFSEYGMAVPYSFEVSVGNSDGTAETVATITGQTVAGYIVDNSDPFYYGDSTTIMLDNITNGGEGKTYQTYSSTIPFSIYATGSTTPVTWTAYDAARNSVGSQTVSISTEAYNITDASLLIPQSAFTAAAYIIILSGGKTYRFDIQRPLKSSDGFRRIWFRNNRGGIGFVDLSGQRSESITVSRTTYEKSDFNFYEGLWDREKEMVLDAGYSESYTLNSFLLKESDLHIFRNLAKSRKVWIESEDGSGQLLYIIIQSVQISKVQNYDRTYQVTVTYKYSDSKNV